MVSACREAMRIVRTLEASFPTGPPITGSAFLAPEPGHLITCAHVVENTQGQRAVRVAVSRPEGSKYEAKIAYVDKAHDLASLKTDEGGPAPQMQACLPEIGDKVVFAGLPQGLEKASVFPGMVSATGTDLISRPRCELIQIAGMINNGNSGGPLLNSSGDVLGVITAKYVPLLTNIDKLMLDLEKIPQFPREVGIGQVDFAGFVNAAIRAMWQLSAVLRLVQVGTGWAIPARYFSLVNGSH
jgi:S1-C subfamily serine protease